MSRHKSRPGVCRICGCTDEMGCLEGCGWADAERTHCTSLVCELTDVLGRALGAPGFDPPRPGVSWRKDGARVLRRARREARW